MYNSGLNATETQRYLKGIATAITDDNDSESSKLLELTSTMFNASLEEFSKQNDDLHR